MGLGKAIADILSALGKEGTFAVGVFVGFGITVIAFWLAGRERKERLKLDLEREKVLHGQLKQKDDRINALHTEIERLIKASGNKKK